MWLYTAQNVVNIPVICSYTGELICPQMPQNEERNISTDSSNRIVHLQEVLPTNFTIFSSFSMIMASIATQWILVPRIFAALDFPRKNGLTRAWTRVENPKWPHPNSKVGSLLDFFSPLKHTYCRHHFRSTLEPPVSDQPKCKDWVIAYWIWSFTRIEPQGPGPRGVSCEKRSRHIGYQIACCH